MLQNFQFQRRDRGAEIRFLTPERGQTSFGQFHTVFREVSLVFGLVHFLTEDAAGDAGDDLCSERGIRISPLSILLSSAVAGEARLTGVVNDRDRKCFLWML